MKYLLLCCCACAMAATAFGQSPGAAPLFETRGVWFATVLADGGWPQAGDDAARQAAALRDRIRQAHALGINTFVFQAVARGDALYPSTRLPWSARPKGAGQDPGYDPLAVAVEEAHRLGMELHAWINVFRVGDTNTRALFQNAADPPHVAFAHPAWVAEKSGQLWLDPSDADARAWLVDNVLEIVRAYDVDAVHFDFIRYPEGGLARDGDRFQADPDNHLFASIDDWRRANVTRFVEDAAAAVLAEKPWVKIGATPIGHYHNHYAWGALSGFFDVFQDSRGWLQDGLADYLAPQIYWDIASPPRFDVLAREWVAEAAGRPVFTGMGVYKPEVQAEVAAEIDTARAAGAAGQVFFRYDHLLEVAARVRSRYTLPALPAPMPHRFEAEAPSVPGDLAVTARPAGGAVEVTLAWAPAVGTSADPLRGYAVFRRLGAPPDPTLAEDLRAVVDREETAFDDFFATAPDAPVYYRVVALSRLGIPSGATAAVAADVTVAATEPVEPVPASRLDGVFPNPVADAADVVFTLDRATDVTVVVYDVQGRRVATLVEGSYTPGRHRLRLEGAAFADGTYFCVLRAGAVRRVQAFVVAR